MISPRLTHVLTRKDLAVVLASTYAASANVEFDEAHERLERAVGNPRILEQLYDGLSRAVQERLSPRANLDELLDNLSAGVQKRRARVKAASITPAVSAALVLINLEIGYAPEVMRGALDNPKGQALLKDGLRALGTHLLVELIK